jgi:diguanylate cyclase (GGDEF)-like protein
VLKQIGQLIHQDLRRTDVAARFGGDEFIAFLPRTDPERAKAVAERLRRMIEDHVFCYKDQRIRVTASFGVATAYCYPTIALDEVVEQADHFLYEAKKNGRNRVCVGNLERDIRRIS